MDINDIFDFLKNGESLAGISLGMPVNDVIDKLGNNFERVGNEEIGYLQYEVLRLGYTKNTIDELAIVFSKRRTPVYAINIDLLQSIKVLDSSTKLHQFILILNYAQIKWQVEKNLDWDYLILKTEAGVGVLFYLDSGEINLISKCTS